jgi:phosphate/sulfate permease
MLLLLALVVGALFGWYRAVRRGGDRFDKLQYAAVHAILFVLVTLVAGLVAGRLGLL